MYRRKPAVAGTFYPDDPAELSEAVEEFLRVPPPGGTVAIPKAVIVPHAGYVYSGPVAGSAYARLAAGKGKITRVILMGPAHRVAFEGLAVPDADVFATPLGDVKLDRTTIDRLLELPTVRALDLAHRDEHSLEVQLPFLQRTLGDVSVIPILAGDTTAGDASRVLEAAWGGPETLIVISSDLSHYLTHAAARRIDEATARAVETLAEESIGDDQACGRIPVRALLLAARAHRLHATRLDLRNSGDTAGPRDRVVGYGAFAFA